MPNIQITHATNAALGLPGRDKTIVVGESGNARSVYSRISGAGGSVPLPMSGPGITPGPAVEQCTMGVLHVDFNGLVMDDRDFANLSVNLRSQLAALVDKSVLVATLVGTGALTSNAIRAYT